MLSVYLNELFIFGTLRGFVFSENLENAEKPQNRAIQIINLNILIINKKIRFMHQKMQNRLPVKVTHANREKIVGFNVFESYLGPPAQFVRQ